MNDCIELFASDAAIPCAIPVLTDSLCESLETLCESLETLCESLETLCVERAASQSYRALWEPIRQEVARLDAALLHEAQLDAWLFGTSVITDALCDDGLDLNF